MRVGTECLGHRADHPGESVTNTHRHLDHTSHHHSPAHPGSSPSGVTISADGKYAFVGETSGDKVVIIDADPTSPTYNQVVAEVPVQAATGAVATPDGKTLYAASWSAANTVSVIDLDPASPTAGTVVATIPVDDEPQDLAISPDGTTLYVTTDTGVRAIDISGGSTQGTVIANYLPGRGFTGAAVSPDNTRLYLTGGSEVSVIDIDPDSSTYQQVIATIPAPAATGAAVSSDGKTLYVSEQNAKTVVAIDVDPQSPTYNQVIATYPLDAKPYDVALTPDGTRFYTVNSGDTVTVTPTGVLAGTATGSDADGDTLTYAISGGPTHGTATIDSSTGAWTYTPDTVGSVVGDSFVVSVDDGHGGVTSQTVTTNAAPTITATPTEQGAATVYTVHTSDADAEAVTVVASTAAHGTVVDNHDGTWTYTPDPAYAHQLTTPGSDSVTFTATDNRGGTTSTTVTPTINPSTTRRRWSRRPRRAAW